MDAINYRGWTIEKETDPWPLKYGWNYRSYHDEHVHGASTIEEAKEEIDEREPGMIFTQKPYDVNFLGI